METYKSGWRPFLGWGVAAGLIALVFAIAFRIATGNIGMEELAALAAALAPVMQYIEKRSLEKGWALSGSAASGGLVNPHGHANAA